MEALVWLAVIVLIVWFFGTAIKSILEGAGEMSNAEFQQLRADQVVRHAQADVKRTAKYTAVIAEECMSADELIRHYRNVKHEINSNMED